LIFFYIIILQKIFTLEKSETWAKYKEQPFIGIRLFVFSFVKY
jgi:hypothetical protein